MTKKFISFICGQNKMETKRYRSFISSTTGADQKNFSRRGPTLSKIDSV